MRILVIYSTRHKMAEKVGELLKLYLKKSGLKKRLLLTRFGKLWEAATDPVISRNSRPKRFSKGVLTIEVDSSALLYELATFRNEEILAKLNSILPRDKVHKLKYELSSEIPTNDAG